MAAMLQFCAPGTRDSVFADVVGRAGYGCGHGVCAPDGMSCICDSGYEHSSYFLFFPDCHDPAGLQTGLLVASSVLALAGAALMVYMAYKTKKTLRLICYAGIITNLALIASNVSLYLEGYNGVASNLLFALTVAFVIRALIMLVWTLLKPSLRMGGNFSLSRHGYLATYILPGFTFVSYAIPSVIAAIIGIKGNFIGFNHAMGHFFVIIAVVPLIVATLPALALGLMFDRVFVTTSSLGAGDSADKSKSTRTRPLSMMSRNRSKEEIVAHQSKEEARRSDSAAGSAPDKVTDSYASPAIPSARLSALIWNYFYILVVLTVVTASIDLYVAVSVYLFQQVPAQAFVWVLFRGIFPFMSFVIARFINNASKTIGSKSPVAIGSADRGNGSKIESNQVTTTVVAPEHPVSP